jgi:hypothetical protein
MMHRTRLFLALTAFLPALAHAQYPPLVYYDVSFGNNDSKIIGVSGIDMVGHELNTLGSVVGAFRRTSPTSTPWTEPYAVLGSTDGITVTGSYSLNAAFVIFSGQTPFFQRLPQVSGYPISFAADSYGNRFAGSVQTTSGLIRAVFWPDYTGTPRVIHPSGYTNSRVTGVGVDREVGIAMMGSAKHAATWQDTLASFRDLHPVGYSQSEINGIYSSFGVGTLWDSSGIAHASTFELVGGSSWYLGGPAPNFGLARDMEMAVGYSTSSGVEHAMLWNLNYGGTSYDLQSVLGPGYARSVATCVKRDSSGGLWIGGWARVTATARIHAILWTIPPA